MVYCKIVKRRFSLLVAGFWSIGAISAAAGSPVAGDDSLTTSASAPGVVDVLVNDTVDGGLTKTLAGFARHVAVYEAGTAGAVPDPVTVAGGSWLLNETEDGDVTTGNVTANASVNDNGSGLNAWVVRDETNGSGNFVQYTRTLTAAEQATANGSGWSLEAKLRFIDDYNDGTSPMLQYGNGSDDLTATTFGTGGATYTITSGGTGTQDFHDFQILYDPGTQTGAFVVDGVRLDAGNWTGQSSGFAGMQWGTGSSGGQGSTAVHKYQVFDQSLALGSGAAVSFAGADVTFDPAGGYTALGLGQSAQEEIDYVLVDGAGFYDTATLTVTVDGVNDAPVVGTDELDTDTGVALVISIAADMLGNDSDPDGDTPQLDSFDATSVEGGTVIDNGDGTLTYTPPPGFAGVDSFDYVVIDGIGGMTSGTVEISVSARTLKCCAMRRADTRPSREWRCRFSGTIGRTGRRRATRRLVIRAGCGWISGRRPADTMRATTTTGALRSGLRGCYGMRATATSGSSRRRAVGEETISG